MEVIGKIFAALPEVSGTSRAGNPWKKREYVLETLETYPKKIFFEFFGEKADQFPLTVGQTIKLFFDIDSHEFNGRWFTSIRAWKTEPADAAAPGAPAPAPYQQPVGYAAPAAPGAMPPPPAPAQEAADDLPF